MARKKKKNNGLSYWLISIGVALTLILAVLKLITGSGNWFRVFGPLLTAFLILFVIQVVQSAVRKIK